MVSAHDYSLRPFRSIGLTTILDELVSRIQTYVSLKAPNFRNTKSFMAWIQDHKPLVPSELTFRKHKDDFVALADGQECGWLDGAVEDSLDWCLPRKLVRVRSRMTDFFCLGRSDSVSLTISRNSLRPPSSSRRAISLIYFSTANAVLTLLCASSLSLSLLVYWWGRPRFCTLSPGRVR